MRAYRIENREGLTVGRTIEGYDGHIHWHCVYELAGKDATLDTLLNGLASLEFVRVELQDD